MKIRPILLLIAFIALAFTFKQTVSQQNFRNNKKLIHTLKDKRGHLLGTVYIEDFKNNVFRKLLITKENRGRADTLYFINNCVFKNPEGVDIEFDKKTFNGYKIELLKDDYIQLFGIGNGSGASDPTIIAWNYAKKIFEVDQTP